MEHDESRFVLERKARRQLQQLIADGNTPQKSVKRARIIVMTAHGHGVMAIRREVGVSKTTVWRWQEYFAEAGVEGLVKGSSKPPGRKPISAAHQGQREGHQQYECPAHRGRTRSQAASRQKFQGFYRSPLCR